MIKVPVLLDSVDKVGDLVRILSKYRARVDMNGSTGTVDARSVLGVFSIDLSEPITLLIEECAETPRILADIKKYKV